MPGGAVRHLWSGGPPSSRFVHGPGHATGLASTCGATSFPAKMLLT
ncbi:MAG: hypothetical protein V7633_4555 [Pseudonocardia sp.]|jgi:hypothetical protein